MYIQNCRPFFSVHNEKLKYFGMKKKKKMGQFLMIKEKTIQKEGINKNKTEKFNKIKINQIWRSRQSSIKLVETRGGYKRKNRTKIKIKKKFRKKKNNFF